MWVLVGPEAAAQSSAVDITNYATLVLLYVDDQTKQNVIMRRSFRDRKRPRLVKDRDRRGELFLVAVAKRAMLLDHHC